MSLIKKIGRKLALGVICTTVSAAACAQPFAVSIAFYGEEAPQPANVWLALDLIDGNGVSDSTVTIWSPLPVSSQSGGVTTVGNGEYRLGDSTGTTSLRFATRNSGILFRLDWADLSNPAPGVGSFDQLTLRLLNDRGQSFLPTADPSGANILASFTGNGMRNFSTSFVEIDAQIPGGPDPFLPPVSVPEPGSLGMMALGMSALTLFARRQRRPR